MIRPGIKDEYLNAMHRGQKEKKEREAAGKDPYPAVLTEAFPETAHLTAMELPLQEIPAERILGTYARGRVSAFSASFLPLPEPESEFAAKWMALCDAHLSDTGIRDPIECYEYLGSFYVLEGNKRVSVLRYFGAARIPARIRRILPPADRNDETAAAYREFTEFHKATGSYDIQFRRSGEYARLYAALGKKPGEAWSEKEKQKLSSAFHYFREAFAAVRDSRQETRAEDALLLFLKVYSYEQLCGMSSAELKKALSALREDIKASAEPDALTVTAAPAEAEKKTVIGKILSAPPKHLNIAFLYQKDAESSPWTRGHAEGAAAVSEALAGSVAVKHYLHADSPEETLRLLDQAAADGAELVFTTAPPLLSATLKAAVKYPKIRFFSCSAAQPLSSVRSYYCRIYEGKFITGLIAGAMAENDLIGYVGSYPILGVPASVNAFAIGARMTNPRARILLEWSCLGRDSVQKLKDRGARVISNRDTPVPDANYMKRGSFGTFLTDPEGGLTPLASPCWLWGKLYENIIRAALSGALEKKDHAVNYWWGMESGAIDVVFGSRLPEGVAALAQTFIERLKSGSFDIFRGKLSAQDGSLISDGTRPLSSLEILKMDRLCEAVEGHIPAFEELLPQSRALVRELGVYRDRIPPQAEPSDS